MSEDRPPNGNGTNDLPPKNEDMVIEFVDHEDPEVVSERHEVQASPLAIEISGVSGGEESGDERVAKLEGQILRIRADFENHRKREARERAEVRRSIEGQVLLSILPILDNFDRALQQAPEGADPTWRQGIELIVQQFHTVLGELGLEAVPGIGAPFDPSVHDAIGMEAGESLPPNHVVRVFEQGYLHRGKMLRPSKVFVSPAGGLAGGAEDA